MSSDKDNKSDNKTSKSPDKARRQAVKGLVVGGGVVVTEWQRPVIDSVVIPAHAAGSPVVPAGTAATLLSQIPSALP